MANMAYRPASVTITTIQNRAPLAKDPTSPMINNSLNVRTFFNFGLLFEDFISDSVALILFIL